jgi:hypothetical protein
MTSKYEKFTPQNLPLLSPVSLTPPINIDGREYHREFSKKFETVLMGHSGARGTLIYEKNSCQLNKL